MLSSGFLMQVPIVAPRVPALQPGRWRSNPRYHHAIISARLAVASASRSYWAPQVVLAEAHEITLQGVLSWVGVLMLPVERTPVP